MKLRQQILWPMACVMLGAVVAASALHAWWSVKRSWDQVEQQLLSIRRTLADTSFPLTDPILRNMQGLSGAEFVVSRDRDVYAASRPALKDYVAQATFASVPEPRLQLTRTMQVDAISYRHAILGLHRPDKAGPLHLHIFYPETDFQRVGRDAVWPMIATGLGAMILVAMVSSWVAGRVTQPVNRLLVHMRDVGVGQFRSLDIEPEAEEIQQLTLSFNRMVEMLAGYEDQVRRREQLRTLDHLGGGIAHQLRNSVTGCRMAIDLHARECTQKESESLRVARRQLDFMEEYLQRFLTLGRTSDEAFQPVAMKQLIDQLLPLLRPMAEHHHVQLRFECDVEPPPAQAQPNAIRQVLVNLVLNAIEAASQQTALRATSLPSGHVCISLEPLLNARALQVSIRDSGAGPAAEVQSRLMEPLVTEKPNGVGLGLALAREVIQRHGTRLTWRREESLTVFEFQLPLAPAE